jgi:hypothetical protein
MAWWPGRGINDFLCIAIPAYDPCNWDEPVAWILYRADGVDFPAVRTLPRRKTHLLRGSTDGLIIVGSKEVLASATHVWKCEGPTDALTLASHLPQGHVAVTNACGAKSFPERLAPAFSGKTVHIVHDADTAGEEGAQKVVGALHGVAAALKVVRLPYQATDSHGKDLRDFINEGNTYEQLAQLAAEAPPAEPPSDPWPPVTPIEEIEVPDFPTHALPAYLKEFVEAEAQATQTPPDLAALVALAVFGAGAARKVAVLVKPGYREPLNLYASVILPPANRKSSVFSDIVRPVEEYEVEERARLAPQIADAEDQREILQKQHEKACKAAVAGDADAARQAAELKAQLNACNIPARPRFVTDDVTPEKLSQLLDEQGGRMAVLSTEGGIFRIMAGCYSATGHPNFEVFLKGHSGDTLRVDRISRSSELVYDPAITVALTVQPDVLDGLVEKSEFRGRGLLGRFLYSLPESLLGRRAADPPPVPDGVRQAFHRAVKRVWAFEVLPGKGKKPQPRVLRFSAEALRCWLDFFRWLEPQLAEDGELADVTDWAGKLCGAVARIAGILHLADDVSGPAPWDREITGETVERAITIGKYLIPHAKAVFRRMGADPVARGAVRIVRWFVRCTLTRFTIRDCYRALRGTFQKVEDVKPCLDFLAEHGYVRPIEEPAREGPGRRPSPAYAVNPGVPGQNGQNGQNPCQDTDSVNNVHCVQGEPVTDDGAEPESEACDDQQPEEG